MMESSSYKIFQAQILSKDPVTPRQYNVVQIPDGYKMSGVQLPNALKDQSAPLLNSIVLILQLDAYRSYIISVLREPFDVLTTNQQYRGFIPSTGNTAQDISIGANPIQDGEIFMEATGPQSPSGQVIPGFGAHLYLGNSGNAQISSGSMSEQLVIGGTGTDDDHEVLLSADNGFIESNANEVTQIQSTYNWDSLNNLQVGNVISNPTTTITIPVNELKLDALGNVTLRNTIYGSGVDLASLKMNPIGNITLTGNTINLNNGTLGAARISDSTLSNPSTDPAFWQFWINQAAIFSALPPATDPGSTQGLANALKAAMVALLNTFPQSITGKISSGSATVSIGN